MLVARCVDIEEPGAAQAHVRRAGVAWESARWAARALSRPVRILLTGLEPGQAEALRRVGRPPEQEDAPPMVVSAGGDAALLGGSRWSVFALAARLSQEVPEAAALSEALGRCLARDERPPEPLVMGGRTFAFDGPAHVMGVVNVTPDSFSDGGLAFDPARAVERGLALHAAGAAIVDVGGESTRPGAALVDADEELARVGPVVRELARQGVPVSVDTSKGRVAREALAAGAVMVNDVTGGADADLLAAAGQAGAATVLMHMRGDPRTMQTRTDYEDLVGEILGELAARIEAAMAAGVPESRIVVDPGLGFAKTAEQNLVLLRRLGAFRTLGRPILVGASRKSFIGRLTGAPADARLGGSVAAATAAALAGAHFVRVHDVPETVQALTVAHAIRTAADEGAAFGAGG